MPWIVNDNLQFLVLITALQLLGDSIFQNNNNNNNKLYRIGLINQAYA